MVTLARTRNMLHALMVHALELPDGIGEDEATIHLQQAINTLIGTPVPPTPEEAKAPLETTDARRILARMDRRAAFAAK